MKKEIMLNIILKALSLEKMASSMIKEVIKSEMEKMEENSMIRMDMRLLEKEKMSIKLMKTDIKLS